MSRGAKRSTILLPFCFDRPSCRIADGNKNREGSDDNPFVPVGRRSNASPDDDPTSRFAFYSAYANRVGYNAYAEALFFFGGASGEDEATAAFSASNFGDFVAAHFVRCLRSLDEKFSALNDYEPLVAYADGVVKRLLYGIRTKRWLEYPKPSTTVEVKRLLSTVPREHSQSFSASRLAWFRRLFFNEIKLYMERRATHIRQALRYSKYTNTFSAAAAKLCVSNFNL